MDEKTKKLYFTNVRVLDISDNSKNNSKLFNNCEYYNNNENDLFNYENNYFETIICTEKIKKYQTMLKIYQMLRPNGLLILFDNDYHNYDCYNNYYYYLNNNNNDYFIGFKKREVMKNKESYIIKSASNISYINEIRYNNLRKRYKNNFLINF
jgi:5S rRNA maturation endonuclease (ribonuclease M5)